ncbi:oxidoreductase [Prauserella flavalba]|uniref:Oxidoreductase n=1 Tax=Prauserella flavalba TaxID=1477506 RepID=A0A318LEU8_9PSEU|nr:oxidoreductase [Prauserella flavalba]PXY24359.1 oxidoreductase [Prauserella flavalba]
MVDVGLFDSLRRRNKGSSKPGTLRKASSADTRHLEEWAASRRGVEAYVEPRTTVTDTTVVLVAHDGEWTRRRIGSLSAAQDFGRKRSIPVYEVARTGYPKRMREYTERQKILERRREQP